MASTLQQLNELYADAKAASEIANNGRLVGGYGRLSRGSAGEAEVEKCPPAIFNFLQDKRM